MKAVVDMLIFLYAVGMPAVGFVYSPGCFQPYCLAFTFFLVLPYICSQHLVVELSDPYKVCAKPKPTLSQPRLDTDTADSD